MFSLNYGLLLVLGIVLYIMITDQNVVDYFLLVFKMMKINMVRLLWIIRFHPNNFITTWIQNRKYARIAKDLEKELNDKLSKVN
jgi:hypothetical protein